MRVWERGRAHILSIAAHRRIPGPPWRSTARPRHRELPSGNEGPFIWIYKNRGFSVPASQGGALRPLKNQSGYPKNDLLGGGPSWGASWGVKNIVKIKVFKVNLDSFFDVFGVFFNLTRGFKL